MGDTRRTTLDSGTLIVRTPFGLVTITVGARQGESETVVLSDFPASAAAVSFSGVSGVVVSAGPVNVNNSAGQMGCTLTASAKESPAHA